MSSSSESSTEDTHSRLLVVDDDAAVRLVASEMLASLGLVATVAESGELALKLFAENSYDAVLLDVGMPIMNGIEVYERIRAVDDDVWVVFMTGYVEEDFNSIEHARTDVLTKPFSLDDLQARIAKIFPS